MPHEGHGEEQGAGGLHENGILSLPIGVFLLVQVPPNVSLSLLHICSSGNGQGHIPSALDCFDRSFARLGPGNAVQVFAPLLLVDRDAAGWKRYPVLGHGMSRPVLSSVELLSRIASF